MCLLYTGAYYYNYLAGAKNYEQVILNVSSYAVQQGIPYQYVQYDAWWYYSTSKFGDGGCIKWEGMPSIFPDGMT